jgi:hypothetical protein
MAKYLMLWNLNRTLIPVSPKERGKAYSALTSFVLQDMESKIIKDWGCYVGEGNGYLVAEGTEVDISKMIQRYSPYCIFSTHPIASVQQMNEVLKSIAE